MPFTLDLEADFDDGGYFICLYISLQSGGAKFRTSFTFAGKLSDLQKLIQGKKVTFEDDNGRLDVRSKKCKIEFGKDWDDEVEFPRHLLEDALRNNIEELKELPIRANIKKAS